MKKKVTIVFLAILCMFLCACAKECTCQCGCPECTCGENNSQDTTSDNDRKLTQKELEAYAKGKEYKGSLRQDGVIIGMISEDQKTMKVSHRGGVWTLDYEKEVKKNDYFWAVIADNGTPDDYTDDVFISFISKI